MDDPQLRYLLEDTQLNALKAALKDYAIQCHGHLDVAAEIEDVLDASGAANHARTTAWASHMGLSAAAGRGGVGAAHAQDRAAVPDPAKKAHAVAVATKLQWQKLMVERLKAVQRLLPAMHLAGPPRSEEELQHMMDETSDIVEAWERIGRRSSPFVRDLCCEDLSKLLYDASDLLRAVMQPVQAANASGAVVQASLLQAVRAPALPWLQSFFADLRTDRRQVGLDDVLHGWYRNEQVRHAQRLGESRAGAACRAACRRGIPHSERPLVWATALGMVLRPAKAGPATGAVQADGVAEAPTALAVHGRSDEAALELLCRGVEAQALLVDAVTDSDVRGVADSEHFFVFEDALRAVMLAFSRDDSISGACATPPMPRFASEGRSGKLLKAYPPSGVLPFHGLAALAAPLLYVCEHPAAAYRVHRALYCRYWCKLHSLCTDAAPAAGLPVLCRTFDELLREVDEELVEHLEGRVRMHPLELGGPFMLSAFSGCLLPAETLLLWDRIIGFDSLLVLPVLAVAVLVFRRDIILAAGSAEELLEVMEDLSQLRVVPLLQALLYSR